MFFLPIGCLVFLLFILFLPILFVLGFFGIATFSFRELGLPPGMTLLVLFLCLIGSMINIPVKKRGVEYVEPFDLGRLSLSFMEINLNCGVEIVGLNAIVSLI